MKSQLIGIIIGLILIVVGGMLISYAAYFSTMSLNNYYYTTSTYMPSCFDLYPSYHYNNTTGTTYSPAYYACEAAQAVNNSKSLANTTRNQLIRSQKQANEVLYSSLANIPGWAMVITGTLTFLLSMLLYITSLYKGGK